MTNALEYHTMVRTQEGVCLHMAQSSQQLTAEKL